MSALRPLWSEPLKVMGLAEPDKTLNGTLSSHDTPFTKLKIYCDIANYSIHGYPQVCPRTYFINLAHSIVVAVRTYGVILL